MKNKGKLKHLLYVIGFIIIIYFYGAGDYGFFQFVNKNVEKRNLEKEITRLENESKQLLKEKDMLENMDKEYLEKVAREKYGMIKEGERVYKIIIKK